MAESAFISGYLTFLASLGSDYSRRQAIAKLKETDPKHGILLEKAWDMRSRKKQTDSQESNSSSFERSE